MVEQEAVNFEVAGSSPAPGAKFSQIIRPLGCFALSWEVRDMLQCGYDCDSVT